MNSCRSRGIRAFELRIVIRVIYSSQFIFLSQFTIESTVFLRYFLENYLITFMFSVGFRMQGKLV